MKPPIALDSRCRSFGLLVLVAVVALTVGGCVVALNPYYRDADLILDPSLEGGWIDEDGSQWYFSAGEGFAYQLHYTSSNADGPSNPRSVEARLVTLGDHRFLDLTVDPAANEHSLFDLHLIPAHSAWHLVIDGDTMTLASLDPSWIETTEMSGRSSGGYVDVDGWRVLTGSTEELRHLLSTALAAPGGLQEPGVLRRITPSDPPPP